MQPNLMPLPEKCHTCSNDCTLFVGVYIHLTDTACWHYRNIKHRDVTMLATEEVGDGLYIPVSQPETDMHCEHCQNSLEQLIQATTD